MKKMLFTSFSYPNEMMWFAAEMILMGNALSISNKH